MRLSSLRTAESEANRGSFRAGGGRGRSGWMDHTPGTRPPGRGGVAHALSQRGRHHWPMTIIIDRAEKLACPKCNHSFALSEGISRQTVERYADEFQATLARHRKVLA